MLGPFSEQATQLVPGIYEHYRGNRYKVLGVGRHSETLEEMVIYQALYGSGDRWVRPLSMFLERVEVGGNRLPRFRLVGIERQ